MFKKFLLILVSIPILLIAVGFLWFKLSSFYFSYQASNYAKEFMYFDLHKKYAQRVDALPFKNHFLLENRGNVSYPFNTFILLGNFNKVSVLKSNSHDSFSVQPLFEQTQPWVIQSDVYSSFDLRVIKDIVTGRYLIYEYGALADDFSGKYNESKSLKLWSISEDFNSASPSELPQGPWVSKYSYPSEFACFSCGCSCYSGFVLLSANETIYAHIFQTKNVMSDELQGVYRFKDDRWGKIIPKIDNELAVSADGCTLGYYIDSQAYTLNTCN